METAGNALSTAHQLYARADPAPNRPPIFKAVGISLAVASGVFIGTSFVLKKTGLLRANVKYNEEAGEGYGYLKNALWWAGMTLMIIGEICNFVAYAFVDAILVTPLGALSVVITTILSAIFLKERLSFVGKIGCFLCIVGSVVILLSAPAQSSAATIQEFQHFFITPGFLTYGGVIILGCAFVAFWVGPRYGKKSMLVYLTICSLIGGLSVVSTQGLGAAIVSQISGVKQYNQPFLYILFAFVVITLLTEIVFLNVSCIVQIYGALTDSMQKALNLFNAALVTPTYYVYFTSATIVTSAILFQGFKGSVVSIVNVVLGFLVICCGVILLQLSKSAKDVPDAAVFKGDLDQVREVAEQQEPESEPKADAIRGTAAIIRRISTSRQKLEVEEAKRIQEEKRLDMMEPIGEDEHVEWDGLRRRKTTLSLPAQAIQRRRTMRPPLGMSSFPEEDITDRPATGEEDERGGAIDAGFASHPRTRPVQSAIIPSQTRDLDHGPPMQPIALTEISLPAYKPTDTPATAHFPQRPNPQPSPKVWGFPTGLSVQQQEHDGASDALESYNIDSSYLAPPAAASRNAAGPTPPPHMAKRQFSFQNVFHRNRNATSEEHSESHPPRTAGRRSISLRQKEQPHPHNYPGNKNATEEERMGLVTGDSTNRMSLPEYTSEDEDWVLEGDAPRRGSPEEEGDRQRRGSPEKDETEEVPPPLRVSEKSIDDYEREYEQQRREWKDKHENGMRDSGLPPIRKDWEGHGPGSGGGGGAFV